MTIARPAKATVRRFALICVLCITGLVYREAAAQPYHDFYFTGIVTSADPRDAAIAPVGSAYRLRIGINYAATNGTGLSFPVAAWGITINSIGIGASFVGGEAFVGNNITQPGGGAFDLFYLSTWDNHNSATNLALNGTDLGVTLINRSPTGSADPFDSRAFPGTIDLAAFSERYMSTPFFYGILRGTIDGFYIDQIPEPDSVALIGFGIMLCTQKFFSRRRRARRRALV